MNMHILVRTRVWLCTCVSIGNGSRQLGARGASDEVRRRHTLEESRWCGPSGGRIRGVIRLACRGAICLPMAVITGFVGPTISDAEATALVRGVYMTRVCVAVSMLDTLAVPVPSLEERGGYANDIYLLYEEEKVVVSWTAAQWTGSVASNWEVPLIYLLMTCTTFVVSLSLSVSVCVCLSFCLYMRVCVYVSVQTLLA